MILADKIINERKKNGWSQEELAEKLSVSRQSVSKWEGAQAIPDIQKIITMADIFGVSTDYLLKDEYEPQSVPQTDSYNIPVDMSDSIPPRRKVTMEEANEYLELEKRTTPKIANAVSMCIMCSVPLIVLTGLSNNPAMGVSEGLAAGIGLICLFGLIAFAVYTFITTDSKLDKFKYLDYEAIDTEYGISGMIKARKDTFHEKYVRMMAIGVILCIVACVPLCIGGIMGLPDYVLFILVGVLLAFIAVGVNMMIRAGSIQSAYDKLLEEADYTVLKKRTKKKEELMSKIYWGIATAAFLTWSFITNRWDYTWIVWPIAGVLFAVYSRIVKVILHAED